MTRGDGLRVQLSPIKGSTLGQTLKLLTPAFRFQCPPLDSFAHTHGHNFVHYTNYLGQDTLRRTRPRLRSIPMRTLIVEYASWVVERRWDLEAMRDAFVVIAEEGYPFRLLATHKYSGVAELDAAVVCEGVVITEQANEQDARYLDFTFTEKDNLAVTRTDGSARVGEARAFPFTITLRKDGSYASSEPTFKTHGEALTLDVIARYAYGKATYATYVGGSQRPGIYDWGVHTALIKHPRFKKNGGKITVAAPPPPNINLGGVGHA